MTTAINRGLEGVIVAATRLSHVDGEAGELIIGGYPVDELAGHATFEEICFLLWRLALDPDGDLPSPRELVELREELGSLRELPPALHALVAASRRVPPMDALRAAAAALSLGDPSPADLSTEANLHRSRRLTAVLPTVVAAHDRARRGLEPLAPRAGLSLAANFLFMIHGREPDPASARALDTYWGTVVDHGLNASTFTARVITSTQSDVYSAVTGAIGALKGPLHGGAPGPVLDMLRAIGTVDRAEEWVRQQVAADKRIMGFGHRVYKVRDPRAEVLSAAVQAMNAGGGGDPVLHRMASEVEEIAIRVLEELKPGRRLRTNVEFYTALLLESLGLQTDQFSAVFACGRMGGWTAHVLEQMAGNRLIRPASSYVGPTGRRYRPVEER
jgi:citrate synthase